jgi:hypothetical protein
MYNAHKPMTFINYVTVRIPGAPAKQLRLYLGGRGALELCEAFGIHTIVDCRGRDNDGVGHRASREPWCSEEGYSIRLHIHTVCCKLCTVMYFGLLMIRAAQYSTPLFGFGLRITGAIQYSTMFFPCVVCD